MSRKDAPSYELPYLRAWREHRFLSQAALAKSSAVSVATVKYLESAQSASHHPASASTVAKLAHALGLTPDQLIGTRPETPDIKKDQ